MSLANRFIQARKQKGISQEELALRVGCAQSLVSRIELGRADRTKFLAEFALELGVSADWLGSNDCDQMDVELTGIPVPQSNNAIDTQMLALMIDGINSAIAKTGQTHSTEKVLKLALILLRMYESSGEIPDFLSYVMAMELQGPPVQTP